MDGRCTLPLSRADLDEVTRRVLKTLERLGYAHNRRDGSTQTVVLRRRMVTKDNSLLLLELDPERLPRGVRADGLTSSSTLHDLTVGAGYRVRALNTTGITYAVMLRDRREARPVLPREVLLRDALSQHPRTPLTVPLGAGPTGPVWAKLSGHLLVGGETGSGKTMWIKAALLTLTLTNAPANLRLWLVDPKRVDLIHFSDSPHLACPVMTTPAEAQEVPARLRREIEVRQGVFQRHRVCRLEEYNALPGIARLPYLVVVIDEVTKLVEQAGVRSAFYRDLIIVASEGLAFGVRLVLATQYPKSAILDTLIRENLSLRLAFKVSTPAHSRVILGQAGAERLPATKGRLLACVGDGQQQELQGYRVENDDLGVPPRLGDNPLAGLLAEEMAMLRYAAEALGGRFPEVEMCRELGVGRQRYRQTRTKLEQRGILARAANNALVIKNEIIPELARLA